ncbi:hypothetical protein VaNZ11_014846 [Volvox africanus]|uniref:Uncharacterized protein n=1 Tax=Volvox africanus TaxID=51714 RepID=A0ABQ5SK78_9CHLO|nr:hypothetical protein VaNZ11_014846 [Volvox africanus]
MEEPYADEFGDDDELFEEILAEGAASDIPASSRDAGAEAGAGSAGAVQPEGNAEHAGTTNSNQADKGKGPQRGIPAAYYEELSIAGTFEERPKPSGRGGPVSSGRGGWSGRGGHGMTGPQPAAGGRGLGHVVGPRGPCIRPMLPAGPVPGAHRPPPGMRHLPNGMLVPLHMQMQMQARAMGTMGLMGPPVASAQLMMHGNSGGVLGRDGREVGPRCRGFGGSGGPGAVMMLQGLAAAAGRSSRTPVMPPPPPPPGAARLLGVRGRGGPPGPPIGLPGRSPGPLPGHGAGPRQVLLAATGSGAGGAIPAMELLRRQMLQAVATGGVSGPILANMAAAGLANPAIAYMVRAMQQQQQGQGQGQQQRQQQEQQPPQQQAGDGDLSKGDMPDLRSGLSAATAATAEATRLGAPGGSEDAEDQAGTERVPGPDGLDLDMPSIFPAELLNIGARAPRRSGEDEKGAGAADGGSSGAGIAFSSQDLGGHQHPLAPPPSLRHLKHSENLPPHLRASAFGDGPHLQQQQQHQQDSQQYRNQPNYRHPLPQQPINQKRSGGERGDAAGWESEAQQLQPPPHKRQMIINPPALRVNGQLQGSHLQSRRQRSFFQEQQQLLSIPSAFADAGQADSAEANVQFADDNQGSDLEHQGVQSPSQTQLQRQEPGPYATNLANGRSSSDIVAEAGPTSGWVGVQNEPWTWRRWSGEVELVGGRGEADDGDMAEAELVAEGSLRHTEELLADAALADPLNPGQTTTAVPGWGSRRPRAGQGPRSGAFWPEPLDIAVLEPARPEALIAGSGTTMGAVSPTSPPRPAARFGGASHKWVREGAGVAPSTATANAAPSAPAATAPASDAVQPAAPPPAVRAGCFTASGAGTAAATALQPPSAVNSEVLKKTEDAIALMKRVIALEEARLKQQQQLKRKKATGNIKTSKQSAGASASAGVTATSSPSITAAGSAPGISELSLLPGKRQRDDSTGGSSRPAKTTTARIDTRTGSGAGRAAPAHATPGAPSHSSTSLNGTAQGGTREELLGTYTFEDDGTGLYDETYEQHHQHTSHVGAAGAGVDAIVSGQVGASTRTAVAGPGSTAAAAVATAAPLDVRKSGGGTGVQPYTQLQLSEQQAAFDEADMGAYDDEDLLLSDDLPAELDGDEHDGEMRLGMTGSGTAGTGMQAGGAVAASAGAAVNATAAKRGRDSGIEGGVQQPPAVQRQRIS